LTVSLFFKAGTILHQPWKNRKRDKVKYAYFVEISFDYKVIGRRRSKRDEIDGYLYSAGERNPARDSDGSG
jgi:hypothetical protein